MIADTTFVVDLLRHNPDATRKLEELTNKGEPIVINAINIFEIFSGLSRSSKPKEEKEKIENLLVNQVIIQFEATHAEKAGEIDGLLIKEGKTIQPMDSMIAGICLVKNEKVLTRNSKDFSKIKNLKIETY